MRGKENRLFSDLISTSEVVLYLTTVFLIRSIRTVPLEVTSAVQVNALPTGTRELLGRTRAGHKGALWSHCWSGCGA